MATVLPAGPAPTTMTSASKLMSVEIQFRVPALRPEPAWGIPRSRAPPRAGGAGVGDPAWGASGLVRPETSDASVPQRQTDQPGSPWRETRRRGTSAALTEERRCGRGGCDSTYAFQAPR